MTRKLENAVRYYLDLSFHGGLNSFKSNPSENLKDLEVILEKIDDYKERVKFALEVSEDELIDDIFPRDLLFDRMPNPLGLDDNLVGNHINELVTDEMMTELGFTEKVRKKKGRKSKNVKRCFEFRGEKYFLSKKITYAEIFNIYDQHGLAHELKTYRIDVEICYKRMFITQKMLENARLDRFLGEFEFILNYLASVFCFCLKMDLNDFIGDPYSHLESVYEKYSLFKKNYDELRVFLNKYIALANEYQSIGWSYFDVFDISSVASVAEMWRSTENDLYDQVAVYERNNRFQEADLVLSYLEVLGKDKQNVDLLNDDKLFEKEVLKENCLVKTRDLQNQIRKRLTFTFNIWKEFMLNFKDLSDGLYLPEVNVIGDIEFIEMDVADVQILADIKHKYVDFFLDEIDVESLLSELESKGIKVEDLESFDLWRFLSEFEFDNSIKRVKLDLFMDYIFWITFGPLSTLNVENLFNEIYEDYINRPLALEDCKTVADYVGLWSYNQVKTIDKIEAEKYIKVMIETVDILSLDAEVRSSVLSILKNNEGEEEVDLSKYCLEGGQIVLNMRKINSFMKVLGACKQSGVGSHVKYSFSIGEVNHSYTIANSVVKSDSFYASMLLQDIAVLNSEPRLVDPVFMEILKLAFSKIGVGLKLKD